MSYDTSTPAARSSPTRALSSRKGRNTRPSRYGSALPSASFPQYDAFRLSVMRSPGSHAPGSTRNGPVPAAQRVDGVAQPGPWRRHVGDTMPNEGVASVARNGANGVRRLNITVAGSGVTTEVTRVPRSKRANGRARSKLNATAAASSAVPSWK